jgi:type VI secretion system protein ImpM
MTMPAGGTGLFGKLPARGDFVRSGLPGSFVTPWDAWLRTVMAGSREQLGEDWLPAWLEAPVWRFVLAPGLCGSDPVLGLMLPSVDRVGRYFPLTLAALLPGDAGRDDGAAAIAWLDAAEQAGRTALEQDATQEQVAGLLPPVPAALPRLPAGSLWWTEGGPRVAPAQFRHPALPGPAEFTAMLNDPAASDTIATEPAA